MGTNYKITFTPQNNEAPPLCGAPTTQVKVKLSGFSGESPIWSLVKMNNGDTMQWSWQEGTGGTWSGADASYQTTFLGLEVVSYSKTESGTTQEHPLVVGDTFNVSSGNLVAWGGKVPDCPDYYSLIEADGNSVKIEDIWDKQKIEIQLTYRLWFKSTASSGVTGLTSPLYWKFDPEVDMEPAVLDEHGEEPWKAWARDVAWLARKYPQVNWADVERRYLRSASIHFG